MATTMSHDPSAATAPGPAWASCLGVVAIVLGVLLTAAQGNEWMKQVVIVNSTPASGQVPPAECPPDELIEEGLSLAECRQMVTNVRNLALSAPDWYISFQTVLAAVGTFLAFVSIIIGAALVNYKRWAPGAALIVFGALAAIDIIGFVAVLNTGPILRDLYLWDLLLWFALHLMMMVGVIAARDSQRFA
jgi:hypothetical protein